MPIMPFREARRRLMVSAPMVNALVWSGLLDEITPRSEVFLAALKIPEHDRIQRLYELSAEDFKVPPNRTGMVTLIEVTMFPGHSYDAKRALYRALVRNLGVLQTDVSVVLREPPMENWGIREGVPASEVDLGFEVEV